jgi:hypothetical protein
MPEYITIQEQVECRTYLCGRFNGKFAGSLDAFNSDQIQENFYDLEFLSGEISAEKKNLRRFAEGEFNRFSKTEKFLTKLSTAIPCNIAYADGSLKHFHIDLNEPKLRKYRLFNQHYEGDKMFVTIEGEISGYLRHFETVEKEIEVPATIKDEIVDSKVPLYHPDGGPLDSGRGGYSPGRGEFHWLASKKNVSSVDWDALAYGCFSVIGGTIVSLYVIVLVAIGIWFISGSTIAVMLSAASPIFLILIPIFLLFILHYYLPTRGSWVIRILLFFLFLFFCIASLTG